MRYDLAVIGSGGGAFAAAIAARRKDKAVGVIERATVGGTCVNTGCVPSKALLAAPGGASRERGWPVPGYPDGPVWGGSTAAARREAALVQELRAEKYIELASEYGWEIVAGAARFAGRDADPVLEVDLNDGGTQIVAAAHYADTGRLLGAHALAEGAGDIISTAIYALANHMTVQEMAELWCPYLTMAEGIKLTAQTFTRDVTKLSCCAS